MPKGRARHAGFTLLELLMVIATISLLAALLLPALSRSKSRAQGTYCMNNSKQLALCMQLYCSDFDEFYPPNPDDSTTMDDYNWCAGNVSGSIGGIPPGPDTFNPEILKNPNKTLIAPYAKNVAIFKCPADLRVGLYSGTDSSMIGKMIAATRSISLNQGVGTVDPAYDDYPIGDNHQGAPTLSVNGPWLNGLQTHRRDQPYATFGKSTSFARVSAAQIFLTLDESPWSINDAAFGVSAAIPLWVDWPAAFHNNACGFSFADGHAEIHKWRTGSLQLHDRAELKPSISSNNPDWMWLRDHATVKLY